MCYNISITKSIDHLENRFDAKFAEPHRYEALYYSRGFSTPYHPVINSEDIHLIQFFQWGLIPFWTRDESSARRIRLNTLNARAETIHEKPSFRASIKMKRCLVLVDGFYEWREENKNRYPYYIGLVNHDAFALAGIWDRWVDERTGETKNTFSIITTRANPLLERIHNTRKRMPVILKQEDERKWLNEDLDRGEIDSMLAPYYDEEMEAYTVSRLVSSKAANTNAPEAIERFQYAELESWP